MNNGDVFLGEVIGTAILILFGAGVCAAVTLGHSKARASGETTCLGAAYAAGLATGVWNDLDELRSHWQKDAEWTPAMDASVRDREYGNWRKAVEKSFGRREDGHA